MALLLSGLVATVATAPQAVAYPKSGTHVVEFYCTVPDGPDAGTAHDETKLLMNYTVTDLGLHPTLTGVRRFAFQLNLAQYHGPTGALNSYMDVQLEYRGQGVTGSTSWLAATGGGTGSHVFPRNTMNAPPVTTRANGIGGINWTPQTLHMRESGDWAENRMWVIMAYGPSNGVHDCSHTMDLSVPGITQLGVHDASITCEVGSASVEMNYEIGHVGGSTYSFEVTRIHIPPGILTTGGGNTVHAALEDSANDVHQTMPLFPNEIHGNGNTYSQNPGPGEDLKDFPVVNFQWYGGQADMPQITLYNSNLSPDAGCPPWELGSSWFDLDEVQEAESFSFNDCTGSGTSYASFTVTWAVDGNGRQVYPKSLSLTNASDSRLTMFDVAGVKALTYNTDFNANLVSFLNVNANEAERTWQAGVTRAIDISSTTKWAPIDVPAQVGAPSRVVLSKAETPGFKITLQARHPVTGAECFTGFDLSNMPILA